MDIKKHYKEMNDLELIKRIQQYEEFLESGILKECELRNDISFYSKSLGLIFSSMMNPVIDVMLLEAAKRYYLKFEILKKKEEEKI